MNSAPFMAARPRKVPSMGALRMISLRSVAVIQSSVAFLGCINRAPKMKYALLGVLWFVVSCGAPVHVGPKYDGTVDFTLYSTFSWTGGTPIVFSGDRPAALRERVTKVVQETVERELARGGFVLLRDPSQSDLILQVLFVSVSGHTVSNRSVPGYAEQYGFARDTTRSTLLLEILDRRSRRVVWKNSVSQAFFGDLQREATDREIVRAIVRALAEFPPQ